MQDFPNELGAVADQGRRSRVEDAICLDGDFRPQVTELGRCQLVRLDRRIAIRRGSDLSQPHRGAEYPVGNALVEFLRPLRDIAASHAERLGERGLGFPEKSNRLGFGHVESVYARKQITSTPLNTYPNTLRAMARTFRERFGEALREAGVTPAQFARDVKMTRSNVSHWLSGRGRQPTAALAKRAAARLAVNLQWLLYEEGPKHAAPTQGESDLPALEPMQEVGGVEFSKQALRVARAFMELGSRRRKEIERQVIVEAMQEACPIDEITVQKHYANAPKEKTNPRR